MDSPTDSYATASLIWLLNHFPHEFILMLVIFSTIFLVILIILITPIIAFGITWLYIHLTSYLTKLSCNSWRNLRNTLPSVFIKIETPQATALSPELSNISEDTNSSFLPQPPNYLTSPVPLDSILNKQTAKKTPPKAKPGPPTKHGHSPSDVYITKHTVPWEPLELVRPFLRYRSNLYAHVQIPSDLEITDIFPPHMWRRATPKAVTFCKVPYPGLPSADSPRIPHASSPAPTIDPLEPTITSSNTYDHPSDPSYNPSLTSTSSDGTN